MLRLKDVEDLRGGVVIDVAPAPGVVGLVMAGYLIESTDSEKIAELYSPHFPQISVVNNDGVASLPHVELYRIRQQDFDILLITRNFFVETSEAGDETSKLIYDYLSSINAGGLMLITSGRITGTGEIYVSSSSLELSRQLLQLGARPAPSIESIPLDKLASFLLLRYQLDRRPTHVIITDTSSYAPDLQAAKKTLTLLSRYLGIEVDMAKLDREIERQKSLLEELERSMAEEGREREAGKPSYIG